MGMHETVKIQAFFFADRTHSSACDAAKLTEHSKADIIQFTFLFL